REVIGAVDLKNGVLLHDAEQQQQAQTGEDVYRLAEQEQREDAEGNRQRQRQQNRDGVNEALELRGQHDVHEDEGQREGQDEVIAGPSELLRSAGEAGTIIGVHMELGGEFIELLKNFSLRGAREHVTR